MKKVQLKTNSCSAGFTLIELLVVITIVGFIGVMTTQIFILGIRSQMKSEVMKELKQNGDYAEGVMSSMIRNAVDIGDQSISCNTNTEKLTILNPDGYATTFDCSDNTKISSISGSMENNVFVPNGQQITLTNIQLSIMVCNFRLVCPTPPLYPKYVFMDFLLTQAGVTPTPGNASFFESQSTVSLRGYE